MKPSILFVCGRNKWRSPTAETIYRKDQRLNVRSAGISAQSGHQINESDVGWATVIIVFEREYASAIRTRFRGCDLPPIECLDIPDEYQYMDTELIELIKSGVEGYIERL